MKFKDIKTNVSLKEINTFGININAKGLVSFKSEKELKEIFTELERNEPFLILGGGSNLLFTKDFNGLVLKNEIPGIGILEEDEDEVKVEVGAGENWHQFVLHCVENGWGGIENLSLIPGTVGAAPMQNIGAYGVEIKDTFLRLKAFEIKSGKSRYFSKDECEFAYRSSIFKTHAKGDYIITHVSFQLTKKTKLHLDYGSISETLQSKGIKTPNLKDVSEAIIEIRQSKLPDPKVLGNAGSFFKNPIVSMELYSRLLDKYPDIPSYKVDHKSVKIPAGWLIEKAGWKGKRIGNAGVHERQALVIVNYGNSTGQEILDLAKAVASDVKTKFQIELESEVNII